MVDIPCIDDGLENALLAWTGPVAPVLPTLPKRRVPIDAVWPPVPPTLPKRRMPIGVVWPRVPVLANAGWLPLDARGVRSDFEIEGEPACSDFTASSKPCRVVALAIGAREVLVKGDFTSFSNSCRRAVAEVGPGDTAVGDVATFGLITSPPAVPPGTVETRDGFQMG
jgi:hypothetical protein